MTYPDILNPANYVLPPLRRGKWPSAARSMGVPSRSGMDRLAAARATPTCPPPLKRGWYSGRFAGPALHFLTYPDIRAPGAGRQRDAAGSMSALRGGARQNMTFPDIGECFARYLTPYPSSRPGGASRGISARSEKEAPDSGEELPPLRVLAAAPVGMTGSAGGDFRRIMTFPDIPAQGAEARP